jgi:CelD/BcsL family acetyltransferase involved in cellulose biosynthesis
VARVQIEEITETEGFRAVAPEWEALWRRDARATPFQHPAWLLSWWTHCGGGRLAVYAGRRMGELVALLPMFRFAERLYPVGIGISDYHDALLAPGEAPEALVAALRRPAELHELRPDSPLAGEEVMSISPFLRLPARLPGKRRRCLGRARRNAPDAQVETARAATLREHLDALVRLHSARWASRGESGVLAADRVRRFHEAAAPALFEAGIARFYGLRLDGRIVSSWYGFHAHGVCYAYLAGFEPGTERLQPGTLVVGHAIEAAEREGCREFDFLRGRESFKYLWGAVDRPNLKRVIE